MSATIAYQCVNAGIGIAKLLLEYRKVQEISRLHSEIQYHNQIQEVISQYIALLKSDVSTLMHMYFNSACQNLNMALYADDKCCRDYLSQAKNRFVDALTIEKNENLILSYLGLSLCQMLLGDINNQKRALRQIMKIPYTEPYIDSEFIDKYIPNFNEWTHILLEYYRKGSAVRTHFKAIFNRISLVKEECEKKIECLNQQKCDIIDEITNYNELSDEKKANNVIDNPIEIANNEIDKIETRIKEENNELINITRRENEIRLYWRVLKNISDYERFNDYGDWESERVILDFHRYAIGKILKEDYTNFHQRISDSIMETFPDLLENPK